MYLSSLYGPVYLVSHIVTMYMMPQLGLIFALDAQEKEFQAKIHPVTTAVLATIRFLPTMMTHHVLKLELSFISDEQLEDNDLNSALHVFFLFTITQLWINFILLYSFMCCVWTSQCIRSTYIGSSWHSGQMVPLFQSFCPVLVSFP